VRGRDDVVEKVRRFAPLLCAIVAWVAVLVGVAGACPPGYPDPGDETATPDAGDGGSGASLFHPDEQHLADNQDPYVGPGWSESAGGAPPVSFDSSGVSLLSWIPLGDFNASATDGADCWGYTSPSGREYAFIGLNTGTGVAEVTDPSNAQVVTHLTGPTSIWRDIKTYDQYAYVVSEGGGGIQGFDLTQIDAGIVTSAATVTTGGGTFASHNVAINETSGRLYRVGGGSTPVKGLRIYDLSDPALPVFVGAWNDRYCHDAQIVTWTEPPFAGVEVAFCYANNTSGGGSPGIDILDVTNPASITLIGNIDLSVAPIFSHPASYSHQGWLSSDRRYIYFNDEVDEGATGNPTTTRVIDVQDLTNPVQVATYSNTTAARDHNLYVKGTRIFQANYRSGFRLLRAFTPTSLGEIAFFDTYPPDDNANYNGLWSIYPYFQSGTVIGSDIEKGLFVWAVDGLPVPALRGAGLLTLCLVLGFAGILTVGRAR